MRYWLTMVGVAAVLGLALGGAQAQQVGAVQVVEVWAYGTPPGGTRQDRYVRDAVVQNEKLETVTNGGMHVQFVDGTILRLGSSSEATLDTFVYDASGGGGEMTANLTRGAFRFISGKLNKSAVQLRTPTALIGIRGTDFLVDVAADGSTVVSVLTGLVTVTNVYGAGTAAVSVAAGQSVSVAANSTAAPAPSAPTAPDPSLSAPSPGPSGAGTGVGAGADGGGGEDSEQGSSSPGDD